MAAAPPHSSSDWGRKGTSRTKLDVSGAPAVSATPTVAGAPGVGRCEPAPPEAVPRRSPATATSRVIRGVIR